MQCPPGIADIVSDILTCALLRIRALGWDKQPERCAIEADHVHNLPRLLVDFKPKNLEYYWHAERESFIKQSESVDIRNFEHHWTALAKHVESASEKALAG